MNEIGERTSGGESKLTFRPLSREDFPLLQQWLSMPHVETWWHEPLNLAGVEAKYGPRVDGTDPTNIFIFEIDRRPVGWIQWYRWCDYPAHAEQLGAETTEAGVDLAIGLPQFVGIGLGGKAIDEFLNEIIFIHQDLSAVVADPQEDNRRSIRAFEKAGFKTERKVHLKGETFARMVVRVARGRG
jgi:aminoglycoside 6'-N-acetyltransferase